MSPDKIRPQVSKLVAIEEQKGLKIFLFLNYLLTPLKMEPGLFFVMKRMTEGWESFFFFLVEFSLNHFPSSLLSLGSHTAYIKLWRALRFSIIWRRLCNIYADVKNLDIYVKIGISLERCTRCHYLLWIILYLRMKHIPEIKMILNILSRPSREIIDSSQTLYPVLNELEILAAGIFFY